MPEAENKRRYSTGTDNNNSFSQKYAKHPPSSYSRAMSFDSGAAPPVSPNSGGYYSYGRRGSLNRTRFILVRTSYGDGKQAFKRVTLPGGSTVAQLRKMIEKTMRLGVVKSIKTLPEQVLVEEDIQISQFADCQRLDVEYGTPSVASKSIVMEESVKEQPIDSTTSTESVMDTEAKDASHEEQHSGETADAGETYPITLLESDIGQQQVSHSDSDTGNMAQEDSSSIGGSTPIEAVPSMDVTPVETEGNDNHSNEVESTPKALRKSVDSDPGDFVKIDNADNGNSDEQHAGALKAKEEVPESAKSHEQEQAAVIESKELPTATVSPLTPEDERKEVEEKKVEVERPREQPKKKHDHKSPYGSLLNWMDQNPNAVRCAATAAAVAGLAGLGAFVYARKVRSGGI